MATEISSLLLHGWENLWKNKVLWIFSFFILINPLLRLIIPGPKNENLLPALLFLALSVASIYFTFMSHAGISYVAYCIAVSEAVDLKTAFQNASDVFWRVVGITFFLLLLISPCMITLYIATYKEPFQLANLSRSLFLLSIPLSIFTAMWFFPITECVANDSKIGQSLKTAWNVFTHHFISLAITGLVLAFLFYMLNVSINMLAMLVQNHLDFAVLSQFDFLSPSAPVTSSHGYKLVSTLAQAVWQTFSASVFTFAYLKYSSAKMSRNKRS
jgi:hypothetical protein